MATFINQKEEVLQIELTPYGKHKLSLGKLKPQYYSFFDSDIIYETPHFETLRENVTGVMEDQNDIVPRIKSTPRPGVQVNFSSLSGSTNNAESAASAATADDFEQITPTTYTFMTPIGTSSPFKDYAPAWNIKIMTGSVGFNNASYEGDLSVPTLSSSIETRYAVTPVFLEEEQVTIRFYEIYEDQKLLIDIQELNTIFKGKGNYDIEVFKAESGVEKGRIDKLSFINNNSPQAEFLKEQLDPEEYSRYLNGTEQTIETQFPVIDNSYVEYYLDIKVDSEITDKKMTGEASIYGNIPSGRALDPCRD